MPAYDLFAFFGRPVCGAPGQVRLQGQADGTLIRAQDVCDLEPGHDGEHRYATVFPSMRLGRGKQEEEPDA